MHLKNQFVRIPMIVAATIFMGATSVMGQVSDREKLDNQQYYQGFIKENINYMREYVDSTNIKLMLQSMEQINNKIGEELAKITVVDAPIEEMYVDTFAIAEDNDTSLEDMETADEDITLDGEAMEEPEKIDDIFGNKESEDGDSSPLDKFLPRKNKALKTNFIINYGINIFNGSSTTGLTPKEKPWSSWFWEYGLQSKLRLGKPGTRVFLVYGASYMKYRFTWEDNVKLAIVEGPTDAPVPAFNKIENLTASPKMRIGYIQVPLGLRVKIAKKSFIEAGAYLGYRLFTSQTHEQKVNDEKISTKTSSDYMMKDWVYGATAGLKIGETRIIAKYNLSGLFEETGGVQAQPFSVGFQSIF